MSANTPSAYKGFNLETGDRILFFLKVGIVALVFLTFGVGATAILAAAACAAMAYEWFYMTTSGRRFDEPLVGIVLAAGAVPPFTTFAVGAAGGAAVAFLGGAFLLMMGPRDNGLLVKSALGIVVIGIAGVCFVWMRDHPEHGLALTAWLIFVVAATEIGTGFYDRNLAARDGGDTAGQSTLPMGPVFSIACGLIAGIVAAIFYREGSLFWVILMSVLVALIVYLTGELTRRMGNPDEDAPPGSLLLGRGAVIENFDGLVWASIFAGTVMMVFGALYGW